jgi:hypothetical protein
MLPSYLQWPCHIYLALGGDKGTKLRIRLTRNGIIPFVIKNPLNGGERFWAAASPQGCPPPKVSAKGF